MEFLEAKCSDYVWIEVLFLKNNINILNLLKYYRKYKFINKH